MMPRPPTSTLFPYTTLFRSDVDVVVLRLDVINALHRHDVDRRAVTECDPLQRLPDRRGGSGDRKSTRLNSSHGYISYAVFCLIKKTVPFRRDPLHVAAARPA